MLCSMMIAHKLCYYFDDRFFEYQGKQYEIVGTVSTGKGWADAIHTVKCGEVRKEVPMRKLVDTLLKERTI